MFKNYVTAATRSLAKHRLYTAINVGGLAIGLAACLLILLFVRDWLSEFAYRIDLSPTFFLGAGLLALAIAWATVAGHAVRVARANPIHALRYE